jgi:hypothetical protein
MFFVDIFKNKVHNCFLHNIYVTCERPGVINRVAQCVVAG